MVSTESLRLMNAVLDDEATAAERAELERLLAAEPAARVQYDELRRLFDALSRVAPLEPRAGFADQVVGALRRTSAKPDQVRQPFAKSGVIGPSGSDIIVGVPAKRFTIARMTPSPSGESAHEYEQTWFVDRWWRGCCRGGLVLQWRGSVPHER